jgi:hypothetical protein
MIISEPTGTMEPPVRRDHSRRPDPRHPEGVSSWRATLGSCVLFLVTGLFLIFQELPLPWPVSGWLLAIQGTLLLGLIVLPAIGFGVAWMQGFPRWSYPYPGNLLLFSLYMMNAATPGLRLFGTTFGPRDLWGWRAWLPALAMLALALAVTRSLRPAERFVARFWRDETLWPWAWFGFLPFLAGISFDEMDRGFSLPFMVLITVVALATALLYLRSPHRLGRVLALGTGTTLLVAIGVGVPALYWQGASGVDVLGSVKAAALLLALLFGPAGLSLLHRTRGVPPAI